MLHTDQIRARADARPIPFACTATHGGLDARKAGRRLVIVRGHRDIYRMFTLTGSIAHVDIGDLEPRQPPAHALQRSLVSQSLLGTGRTARHRGHSHGQRRVR